MCIKKFRNELAYKTAVHRMAEISELLTKRLDDKALDLFEEYGDLHEYIIKCDIVSKKAC